MTDLSPQIAAASLFNPQSMTLIPCGTLEDFPSYLEDSDAQSLLAAWTTPWHPALLAITQRLPTWARADSIPDRLDDQIIFVPKGCLTKLPSGFTAATQAATRCRIIHGTSREQFLQSCESELAGLPLESISLTKPLEVASDSRIVTANDFYALGYAWLQVQIMTRRLRYTSNIDEIYFAGRAIEAAKMMLAGDADATVTALHDAFDALAQERDHYFSNDPHLVDLTLLASSTLGPELARTLAQARSANEPPINFLIDSQLAVDVVQSPEPASKELLKAIDEEIVGVAGGGLPKNVDVHHQTAASVRHLLAQSKSEMDQAIGKRCDVFARSSGPTPGDLSGVIAQQSYIGAIPINFAAGEGWSNESKLIWSSTSPPIDVLVSKPIDGSRSDAFLSLAVRLGQAIDSGEVATALVVHWPGQESDAYLDLRRAASWGLAMGRFWKIDDYFRDGQRPYHHYRGRADDGSAQWLTDAVDSGLNESLKKVGQSYRQTLATEVSSTLHSLADLIRPQASSIDANISNDSLREASTSFAKRLGAIPVDSGKLGSARLIVNPHSAAARVSFSMGNPPEKSDCVYGASLGLQKQFEVTVDVPAQGFVIINPSSTPPKKRWFVPRKRIASSDALANEFMQVEFSATSGGVKGVYSGSGRGNRFSLRLIHVDDDAPADDRVAEMNARSIRVVRSDESIGIIEVDGIIKNQSNRAIADFKIYYSLSRGSRWLWVDAEIKPAEGLSLGSNPWRSYFAFRSAIASEASTILAPLRDKLHRAEGKRIDAPGGLLIDEITRQTLLFADGRPAYRQRGDRFIDSLCLVRNELAASATTSSARFAVGFDVPRPIDALRGLMLPPSVITCEANHSLPKSGWLVHCSAPDVVITDIRTESTSPLSISCLVIASRSESKKAKIRFCRNVASAVVNGDKLQCAGDTIEIPLSGFEVARVSVQFEGS